MGAGATEWSGGGVVNGENGMEADGGRKGRDMPLAGGREGDGAEVRWVLGADED